LIFDWKEGKETPGGPDKGQTPSLLETGARGYRYLPVPGWPDASSRKVTSDLTAASWEWT